MAGFNRDTELAAMELYENAMDAPSNERETFIADHPDYTDDVKQRALALALSEGKSLRSLRTGGAIHLEDEDDETVPDQVGAYRILCLLGRGGMGAVYLGERAADDFEHIVAIKVIKTGLLSDQLVERFQRERQILAQLNHPNIAHFHDGGETEAGAPYIIMEYVDGVPLTEWLKQEEPGELERLKLFRQICDAVAFAHQNLVIHRDLTPGNVMVTQGDQAKLIDFGIARPQMDDEDESKASSFTGLSLTPGFAAPERSSGLATNTLTDIYSLGKLLELLLDDGKMPEIRSIITKATKTDPAERYDTVDALIRDLESLKEGRPVLSYSSARLYQFRKFISRHKLSALATIAALTALIGAFTITYIQYNNAQARFTETRELTSFLLNEIPDDLSALPGTLPVMEKVTGVSARYLDILAKAAESDDAVRLDYAIGRMRLGELLTVAGGEHLGKPEEGVENFEAALFILKPMMKNPNVTVETQLAYAKTLSNLAFAKLYHLGDIENLGARLNRSSNIARSIIREHPDNIEARVVIADNFLTLARAGLQEQKDPSKFLEKAKISYKNLLKLEPDDPYILSRYARMLYVISTAEADYWSYLPNPTVPNQHRRRYVSAINNLEECERVLKQLMQENSVNPLYKLQFVESINAHAYLLILQKQWEPAQGDNLNILAAIFEKRGRAAVLKAINDNDRFRKLRLTGDEMLRKLDKADSYLASLEPYEGETFHHQEAVFYNLIVRAQIEKIMNFDMDASLSYIDQALTMLAEFEKANPDFRNVYTERAYLWSLKADLLRINQEIYGSDHNNEACRYLSRANILWQKVEAKWGPVDDYAPERNFTKYVQANQSC